MLFVSFFLGFGSILKESKYIFISFFFPPNWLQLWLLASDRFGGGSFAKLFVGSVPRTATEEDVISQISIVFYSYIVGYP